MSMSGKEGRKWKAKIVFLPLCFHGSIGRNESVRSGYELPDKKEVYLFPLKKILNVGVVSLPPGHSFCVAGFVTER